MHNAHVHVTKLFGFRYQQNALTSRADVEVKQQTHARQKAEP